MMRWYPVTKFSIDCTLFPEGSGSLRSSGYPLPPYLWIMIIYNEKVTDLPHLRPHARSHIVKERVLSARDEGHIRRHRNMMWETMKTCGRLENEIQVLLMNFCHYFAHLRSEDLLYKLRSIKGNKFELIGAAKILNW